MTGVISGIVAEVECRVARTLLQKEGEKTQTFEPNGSHVGFLFEAARREPSGFCNFF